MTIVLSVNGTEHAVTVEPRRTFLDALRHDLALTGTKRVCDMGDCGPCAVLLDGRGVYACLLLAVDCRDWRVTTRGWEARSSIPCRRRSSAPTRSRAGARPGKS
jgi:xanthine dehydrogenase YagT iron-sulfur-binding subunit